MARYTAEMDDHVYLQRVREQLQSGMDSGVRATPTFFVNGRIQDVSFGLRALFDAVEAILHPRRGAVRVAAGHDATAMGMRTRLAMPWVVLGALQVGAALGADAVSDTPAAAQGDDPYLWLEDVHGRSPSSGCRRRTPGRARCCRRIRTTRRTTTAILHVMDATDRIPYGDLDHGYVFNFWQDAQHPKGIWRRTTLADYRRAAPDWELLLDLDRLAADEHENWVWKGAECAPSMRRCLLSLSRGGGDAVVVREFDLRARSFPADGFQLTEAKSAITYLERRHACCSAPTSVPAR